MIKVVFMPTIFKDDNQMGNENVKQPPLDDEAYALFAEIHRRLGYGPDFMTRVQFATIEGRRRAWLEIARVMNERIASATIAAKVATVAKGEWLRRAPRRLGFFWTATLVDGHQYTKIREIDRSFTSSSSVSFFVTPGLYYGREPLEEFESTPDEVWWWSEPVQPPTLPDATSVGC